MCGLFLTIYFCDKKKLPQNKLLQKWIVRKTAHKITVAKINRQKNCAQNKALQKCAADIFLYLLAEVESRTQGSRPRPRTQKKSEAKAKAKDSLSEDRHSRGQGQECSRPRPRTKDTGASVLKKKSSKIFFKRSQKKKKVFTKIFQAISTKKRFPKKFSSASQNFNNSKNTAVLEPRTGQFSRT